MAYTHVYVYTGCLLIFSMPVKNPHITNNIFLRGVVGRVKQTSTISHNGVHALYVVKLSGHY